MHGEKKQHKHGSSKKEAKKKRMGELRGERDYNQKWSQFVCLVCQGTPQNLLLPFCVVMLRDFNSFSLPASGLEFAA